MLSSKDYELLLYIRDNPQNAKLDTVGMFGPSTYARLKHMSHLEAIKPSLTRQSDGGYVHTGYEITDVGHMLIEDQYEAMQEAQSKMSEERLWRFIPIAISLAALAKSFAPEIWAIWCMLQSGQ